MMKKVDTSKFQGQMQSVKDHIQQYQDGLITGYEAFNAIKDIVGTVNVQPIHDEHVQIWAEQAAQDESIEE